MWTSHQDCANLVHESWNTNLHNGSHAFCLTRKIDSIRKTFRLWNKTSFGRVEKTIQGKKDELRSIQEQLKSIEDVKLEREVKEQLEDLIHREEVL